MTTRRIPKSTQDLVGPQHITADNPATSSNIQPAVPTPVIIKLLIFTFAMILAPISTFFLTKATIFSGNTTWAGAAAAVVANVVLIGYVVVAVLEDQGDNTQITKSGAGVLLPEKGKEKKAE